jgi:DNA-binding XRE family transcriptional regulator
MEMVMKVNVPLIKRLREEKSWSQEHLAEASGISLRTIQRVETEGNASSETKLALAATLGVDVAELQAPGGPGREDGPGTEGDGSSRAGFLRHGILYTVICGAMVWTDIHSNGQVTWSQWPVMGWGVGLLSHGLRVWKAFQKK